MNLVKVEWLMVDHAPAASCAYTVRCLAERLITVLLYAHLDEEVRRGVAAAYRIQETIITMG